MLDDAPFWRVLGIQGTLVLTGLAALVLYLEFTRWSTGMVVVEKHLDRMVLIGFIGLCVSRLYWLHSSNSDF